MPTISPYSPNRCISNPYSHNCIAAPTRARENAVDATDVKNRLLHEERLAAGEIEQIRRSERIDADTLERLLRRYVLFKFSLYDINCDTDNINLMARKSLAKLLNVDKSAIGGLDAMTRCDGSNAIRSKKILLYIALQRALGIKIPLDAIADIITLGDLAKTILPLLENRMETR